MVPIGCARSLGAKRTANTSTCTIPLCKGPVSWENHKNTPGKTPKHPKFTDKKTAWKRYNTLIKIQKMLDGIFYTTAKGPILGPANSHMRRILESYNYSIMHM